MVRAAVPVREALEGASTAIAAGGADTPRLDAELLVAAALDVDRMTLLADAGLVVSGSSVRVLQELVRRRAIEREPVAYLIGRKAFRQLVLEVDRRAMIPRPETELVVDIAVRVLAPGARVLDAGTGSGAIALALAHERPDLTVCASDISSDALALARANGARLGLEVDWWAGDLLDAVDGRLDAIVSNPPYVATRERAGLAPEILRHEPALALFAGADGLAVLRRLVGQAATYPVDLLLLEVGQGHASVVADLLRSHGFGRVEVHRDLAAIERVVVGRR